MDAQNKKIVYLFDLEGSALIFHTPSGVIYANHAGGDLDLLPEAEGILIPFNFDLSEYGESLENLVSPFFKDSPEMSLEIANAMDEIFMNDPATSILTIDRSRLTESVQNWVYINIEESEDCFFYNFGKGKGVLTWQE